MLKEKCQHRILYPAELAFISERKRLHQLTSLVRNVKKVFQAEENGISHKLRSIYRKRNYGRLNGSIVKSLISLIFN